MNTCYRSDNIQNIKVQIRQKKTHILNLQGELKDLELDLEYEQNH